MHKGVRSLILVIAMMGYLVTPTMASEILPETKEVYILNISPEIIEGRTFVPVKLVAQQLNAKVEWLQESKRIILTREHIRTELKAEEYVIGSSGESLVSFDMIAQKFNLEAIYNEAAKEIKLVPLVSPIAKIKLTGGPYIEGRTIPVLNESYSPGGALIIDSLWEISGHNQSIQTKDLNKISKTLKVGSYNIKLKVKNSQKVWSEWTKQTIIIEPHPKPVITSFAAIELELDQGERLSFKYNTEVSQGNHIVESKWTYQKEGHPQPTIGEPRAFFEEGTYTISLEVKDDEGYWSLPATTQVYITDLVVKTELQFKLENTRHGDTLENFSQYNFQNYEAVEDFIVRRGGPTLLFSNSPETVLSKGVLYADKVVGDTRVLYHHRNGMQNSSQNTRLVITVENKGNEPVTITQTKKSNGGPSADILHLGQIVTRRYFNSNLGDKIILQANEKKYLYDTGKTIWPDYESFSGVLEFNSDKIITVTVAAVDRDFKLKDLESLSVAPRDGIHTRGTFPAANKYYSISIPGDKPSKIMLGQEGDNMDSWIDGYDALTNTAEKNKGNYGVIYELNLKADEETGILFNPRGTSFKGAYRWENAQVSLAPIYGMFRGSQQSSVAGVVDKRSTKKLFYTLSNGSSGPVLFNFIPESFWSDHKIKKEND